MVRRAGSGDQRKGKKVREMKEEENGPRYRSLKERNAKLGYMAELMV